MPATFLPRKRRLATAVAALFAATALTAGVFALRSSNAASPGAEPPPTPVMVATVVQADVATWDDFSGRLEAVERVDVRSRVAGAVQSVHFREGSLVKVGELLVSIDPAPYAAEVDRAQAQVAAAQSRVTYVKSEHERAQRLWDESAIARRELDERGNARQEAEANLRDARPVRPASPGTRRHVFGAPHQRARGGHRPEQEVRDGGGRRQQGRVSRGFPRRERRRAAHRDVGIEARRTHRRERAAARAPRLAGGAPAGDDGGKPGHSEGIRP